MSPPWPVALLTGLLGSGKTTLERALRLHDGMVMVNEFADIGIDHELIAAVHGDVVLLRGGCMCCGVRQDLARTLRDLHLQWRAGSIPYFTRMMVETSGLAEPGPVVATLVTHPLVQDAYALRGITTLVDAEHGPEQLRTKAVGRRQVAVADRLLISKPDRASQLDRIALKRTLARSIRLPPSVRHCSATRRPRTCLPHHYGVCHGELPRRLSCQLHTTAKLPVLYSSARLRWSACTCPGIKALPKRCISQPSIPEHREPNGMRPC